jgi:hypothetical protein
VPHSLSWPGFCGTRVLRCLPEVNLLPRDVRADIAWCQAARRHRLGERTGPIIRECCQGWALFEGPTCWLVPSLRPLVVRPRHPFAPGRLDPLGWIPWAASNVFWKSKLLHLITSREVNPVPGGTPGLTPSSSGMGWGRRCRFLWGGRGRGGIRQGGRRWCVDRRPRDRHHDVPADDACASRPITARCGAC